MVACSFRRTFILQRMSAQQDDIRLIEKKDYIKNEAEAVTEAYI